MDARSTRKDAGGDGAHRRLEGSQRGAEQVRTTFGALITRRRYAQLVGIHPTTLGRWEKAGVIRPTLATVLNSPTWVFSSVDVEYGRRLAELLKESPGTLSLADAARRARTE